MSRCIKCRNNQICAPVICSECYEKLIAENAERRTPLPDNKALTVEELREMDGERVWVQFRDIGMYALVAYHADPDGDDGDEVYLTNNLGGRDTYEEIIGQGGDVYRRPPEKGT